MKITAVPYTQHKRKKFNKHSDERLILWKYEWTPSMPATFRSRIFLPSRRLSENVNIQICRTVNFPSYFIWVWNLVFHNGGRTQADGVQWGAAESIEV